VELAAALGTAQSGGVIMAALAAVFTIGYVANMLGEDEDWLHDFYEKPPATHRRPSSRRNSLPCGPHRMLTLYRQNCPILWGIIGRLSISKISW
jgi:hypothetical protein